MEDYSDHLKENNIVSMSNRRKYELNNKNKHRFETQSNKSNALNESRMSTQRKGNEIVVKHNEEDVDISKLSDPYIMSLIIKSKVSEEIDRILSNKSFNHLSTCKHERER